MSTTTFWNESNATLSNNQYYFRATRASVLYNLKGKNTILTIILSDLYGGYQTLIKIIDLSGYQAIPYEDLSDAQKEVRKQYIRDNRKRTRGGKRHRKRKERAATTRTQRTGAGRLPAAR